MGGREHEHGSGRVKLAAKTSAPSNVPVGKGGKQVARFHGGKMFSRLQPLRARVRGCRAGREASTTPRAKGPRLTALVVGC
jgi:hypothetical protein